MSAKPNIDRATTESQVSFKESQVAKTYPPVAVKKPIRSASEPSQLPASIPNSSLLEHIATSRFFHHYVSPTRTFVRLDLDYLSSVIDHATKRNILAEAIIALGILTLPTKTRVSWEAARCRYSRALRFTNKALADAEQAKSDEALMAVILIGLYQVSWLSQMRLCSVSRK